jgi:Protein of unknown function (DUF3228)
MSTIKLNDFVLRQTAESPYSHFDGTWDELLEMVKANLPRSREGFRDGVLLVPVPPDRFRTAVTPLSRESILKAEFASRRADEEPFIRVNVIGPKTRGAAAEVVVYRRDVLGPEATTDADYEVISINVSLGDTPEPMHPVAMARNFLGLAGGTKGNYSAEQFARAIIFWATHAMAATCPLAGASG